MDKYQQFIHKSRYARWIKEEGRRETWEETVQRYVDFWTERGQIDSKVAKKLYNSILQPRSHAVNALSYDCRCSLRQG